MATLTKYTSFEALKADKTACADPGKSNEIYSELEKFLILLQTEGSKKKTDDVAKNTKKGI